MDRRAAGPDDPGGPGARPAAGRPAVPRGRGLGSRPACTGRTGASSTRSSGSRASAGDNGKLVISGCAFVPSVDITKRRHASKIVVLVPRTASRLPIVRSGPVHRAPVRDRLVPAGPVRLRLGGLRAQISPRWFRARGPWLTGDWDAYCWSGAAGRRPARLHTPVPGPAERPARARSRPASGSAPAGWAAAARAGHRDARRAAPAAQQVGDELMVEVDVERPARPSPAADSCSPGPGARSCARRPGAATQRRRGPAARRRPERGPAARPWPPAAPGGHGGRRGGRVGPVRPVPAAGAPGSRSRPAPPEYKYQAGRREIAVSGPGTATPRSCAAAQLPVIDEHAWTSAGTLTLSGSYAGRRGQARRLLRRKGSTDLHVLAVARDGERFTSRSTRPRCRRSAPGCRCATGPGSGSAPAGQGRASDRSRPPTIMPGWPRSATGG